MGDAAVWWPSSSEERIAALDRLVGLKPSPDKAGFYVGPGKIEVTHGAVGCALDCSSIETALFTLGMVTVQTHLSREFAKLIMAEPLPTKDPDDAA